MPKPYIPNDHWSRRAQAEGYRARSVYKLMELDQRFHLLQPGITVLDLGAAPGSWLQYAAKRVGPTGLVIGVDTEAIAPVGANAITLHRDITNIEEVVASVQRAIEKRRPLSSESSHSGPAFGSEEPSGSEREGPSGPRTAGSSESCRVDLVLSDAAPQTSGIKDIDQWRSLELGYAVLGIATKVLRRGGTCVLKVFRGADFDAFLKDVRREWRSVRLVTVKASRDRSREVYLVTKTL